MADTKQWIDENGTVRKFKDEYARTQLETKVDKVDGKGLSTNDYSDDAVAAVATIANKADTSAIPSKTSELTNDSGFITTSAVPTKTSELTNDGNGTSNFATVSQIPTQVSSLTNDSGFITKAVNDLTNYYLKSDTYTKTEVNSLVEAIPKFDIKVVDTLPTGLNISTTTIYLKRENDSTGNLYTEYIYVNSAWEILGSQQVDLTGYATETYVGQQISALGLGDASKKGIVTTVDTSANLPTSNAVKNFVENKGYITSSGTASNVSGTVAIGHGGTGATTVAGARNALGLGNTDGALPVANGGTAATTAANARTNLGLGTAATASTTTSVTSGSSALVTSGAVYTSVNNVVATTTTDPGEGATMTSKILIVYS